MKRFFPHWFRRIAGEDLGGLSFEWILLITLLVIGIVGGLSAVRDAVISEMGDVAGAMIHIDQSYTVETDEKTGWGNSFHYQDEVPELQRNRPEEGRPDQGPVGDCGSP